MFGESKMLEQSIVHRSSLRVLSFEEIEMVSGGTEEIVITAPRPTWNSDLGTYSVMLRDGGYVTYDRLCADSMGFGGCYYPVSGGGTYEVNGGGFEIGSGGLTLSEPTYTYTPTAN